MRESKIETLSNNTSINDLRSNSNECKKKEIEMEKTRDTGDRNLHRPCTIILMYTTVTWTRDERTRWMSLPFFSAPRPSLSTSTSTSLVNVRDTAEGKNERQDAERGGGSKRKEEKEEEARDTDTGKIERVGERSERRMTPGGNLGATSMYHGS